MNDEIEVLGLVAARLDAAGIAYMVTGSLALAGYALPRMTRDIDVVIAVDPDDAPVIAQLFANEFHCDPDSIRNAITRRGLFNLIHTTRVVKVDFIVRKATPFGMEEFSRRRRLDVAGQAVWVVTAEDLLLSKLVWAMEGRSAIQLADAAALVHSAAIDWSYTDKWAAVLGVESLLREVRR